MFSSSHGDYGYHYHATESFPYTPGPDSLYGMVADQDSFCGGTVGPADGGEGPTGGGSPPGDEAEEPETETEDEDTEEEEEESSAFSSQRSRAMTIAGLVSFVFLSVF